MKQPQLGLKIVELRKIKRLTQEELVEKSNINIRTLQRIESGRVIPRLYTIRCLLKAMEYDIDELDKIDRTNLHARFKTVYETYLKTFYYKFILMKKVSLLTLFILGALIFVLGTSMSKHNKEPLLINRLSGTWKLFGEVKNAKTIKAIVPRYMRIEENGAFVSSTISGEIYNMGDSYTPTDSTFITVHHNGKGNSSKTANLYYYTLKEDTLRFSGYYLRQRGSNNFSTIFLDEIWVRTKPMTSTTDTTKQELLGLIN